MTIDSYCNNGAYKTVYTSKLQPDGKTIIGGDFTLYNGTLANRIARVNTDLTLDSTFNVGNGFDDRILASAIQPNGKIIIGGVFTKYNGVSRKGICRLNANGSLDITFSGIGINNVDYPAVNAIAIQSDGKILIGGYFSSYNGINIINIARLNADGTLDTAFNSNFITTSGNMINCIALETGGKIILGGDFQSYGTTSAPHIVRLIANGLVDSTFNIGLGFVSSIPGNFASLKSLKLQTDGKILAGGEFGNFNGSVRKYIARLNTNGSLDTTFLPDNISFPAGGQGVNAIDLQSDGKILIAGGFKNVGALSRERIALLNSTGTLDSMFNPGTGFGPVIGNRSSAGILYSVNVQSDGKFVVGGKFSTYNTINVNNFTRLNPTTGAIGRYTNNQFIKQYIDFSTIHIFPNPITVDFKISSPEIMIDKIEIYNTIGQLVKIKKLASSDSVISIDNLISGIYYVKMYSEDKFIKSDKIIKK